jgi:hypothetical protein
MGKIRETKQTALRGPSMANSPSIALTWPQSSPNRRPSTLRKIAACSAAANETSEQQNWAGARLLTGRAVIAQKNKVCGPNIGDHAVDDPSKGVEIASVEGEQRSDVHRSSRRVAGLAAISKEIIQAPSSRWGSVSP